MNRRNLPNRLQYNRRRVYTLAGLSVLILFSFACGLTSNSFGRAVKRTDTAQTTTTSNPSSHGTGSATKTQTTTPTTSAGSMFAAMPTSEAIALAAGTPSVSQQSTTCNSSTLTPEEDANCGVHQYRQGPCGAGVLSGNVQAPNCLISSNQVMENFSPWFAGSSDYKQHGLNTYYKEWKQAVPGGTDDFTDTYIFNANGYEEDFDQTFNSSSPNGSSFAVQTNSAYLIVGATSNPALAGKWSAGPVPNSLVLGTFIFTIDATGENVTSLEINVNNGTCAGSGLITHQTVQGPWPISGGQFSIVVNIRTQPQIAVTINGSFRPAQNTFFGTWTAEPEGSCLGTWLATPMK